MDTSPGVGLAEKNSSGILLGWPGVALEVLQQEPQSDQQKTISKTRVPWLYDQTAEHSAICLR